MKLDSNNRIIGSIDSTLVEIGPVTATLKETGRKSGVWHVGFIFNYGGKEIDTYTGEAYESKDIPIYEGFKILNKFMKDNDFYIKFPEDSAIKAKMGHFPSRTISLSRKGTAYVHKDKDWFKNTYLESRIKE